MKSAVKLDVDSINSVSFSINQLEKCRVVDINKLEKCRQLTLTKKSAAVDDDSTFNDQVWC